MANPLRGEIWRVNFDPTQGAEMRKIRPAVVISDDDIGRLALKIVSDHGMGCDLQTLSLDDPTGADDHEWVVQNFFCELLSVTFVISRPICDQNGDID